MITRKSNVLTAFTKRARSRVCMRTRKASKKPQYASAFELFCDGRDFAFIASQTGLPQSQVERCAVDQNWERRRGAILGAKSVAAAETRLQAQAVVDSTLVNATRDAAHTLAKSYVRLIEEASALPTEPFADEQDTKMTEAERDRAHRRLIRDKTEVMKLATSGLRELIETAQNVGLLNVERGGKTPEGGADRDKPIDLSKLTQLNIAIVNATNGNGASRMLAQVSAPGADDLRKSEPVTVQAETVS